MKVIIIGGVAGGATAAARIRRLNERAEITIYERGEFVSFANCGLPYHLSGVIPSRDQLVLKTPGEFKSIYNVEVKIFFEVIKVLPTQNRVQVKNVKTGELFFDTYDKLLLSPGAAPFTPPFENSSELSVLTLRNIPDMDLILSKLSEKNIRNVLILGGGFIGVEVAENLVHRGLTISLIELSNQILRPLDFEMANILHEELVANGVNLLLERSIKRVYSEDGRNVVELSDGHTLQTDLIISAVGVRADTSFLKDSGITINGRGAIVVNSETLQTSIPNIYAVGDAIEVTHIMDNSKTLLPLAGPANRQARVVADQIYGVESKYKGVQGTSIIKVFNLAAASTGIAEKDALVKMIDYKTITIHPNHHVTYYPGATQMTIKVIYSPSDYKIFGAQVVGIDDVARKIDVLAMAIRSGLTLFDLQDIEFAYAPPFGLAKDPINMLGFVADNIRNNLVQFITVPEMLELRSKIVLDVRTKGEFESGHIKNAINIPLHEIRSRLSEIPKDKKIIVHCMVGIRSYNAYRILSQLGFSELFNLSGGYKSYLQFTKGKL